MMFGNAVYMKSNYDGCGYITSWNEIIHFCIGQSTIKMKKFQLRLDIRKWIKQMFHGMSKISW